MNTVLAIIPARGGSKGVPRKNLRQLAGKPLIGWTIETALNCTSIDRVIVSTDDIEIARGARDFGAEIPFTQPKELALDNVPDFPVCYYALHWLETHESYTPDIVVWLRPTAPLRRIEDINAVINILISTGADSVRSVSPATHHPYWMKRLEGDILTPFMEGGFDERNYPQRQSLPSVYYLNGVVDATWAHNVTQKNFLFGGDMRGYVIEEFSPDMDTELDFIITESWIKWRREDENS